MRKVAAGVLSLAGILLAGCSPVTASDGVPSAAESARVSDSAVSAPVPAPTATEAAPDPAVGDRLAALVGEPGGRAHVVLLGDSFAAGEGAGSYRPVNGIAESLCHRSSGALLSEAADTVRIHNFACSRARISDLGSTQQMEDHPDGLPGQLEEMRGLRPDLVLLYIGGNDAGFAGLLQACIAETEPCGEDTVLREATGQKLEQLRAPLAQLYTELGTAVQAPVLVLPYPRLFDAPREDCGRLAPEELAFGLAVTDALNSTIEQAVQAADLPNVRYVDALEDSFASRGACSADPLVNTARIGSLLTAVASVSASQEVLHPTEEGYRVLTGDLLQWMEEHPM